jgi:hypothetical protein
MKTRKTFLLSPYDGLFYEHELSDVTITRISPRSYRQGEKCGFVAGLSAGIILGVMLVCFMFGIL